ncbi:Fungalysin/Thermolysin Extracellular metalloproteinase 5 [Lobulomyces angularis]|nr:Fungalysin/Thermolysin Extracellular metalloproteinase 5 [Lobulomyces angularis]
MRVVHHLISLSSLCLLYASIALKYPTSLENNFFFPKPTYQVNENQVNSDTITPSTFTSFTATDSNSNTAISNDQKIVICSAYLSEQLSIKQKNILCSTVVETSTDVSNVHCSPLIKNLEVVNAAANCNINRVGVVVGFGSSWVPENLPVEKEKKDSISPVEAFKYFADIMNIKYKTSDLDIKEINGENTLPYEFGVVKISKKLYMTAESLNKVFALSVPTENDHFNVYISTSSKEILGVLSLSVYERGGEWKKPTSLEKRDFKYNVVGLPSSDISKGRVILTDPADSVASPKGWHFAADETTTNGNNIYARDLSQGFERKPVATNKNFDFPIDLTKDPASYWEASVVNAFYVGNVVHDISFKYGFDEQSGNFQYSNFGTFGKGGDVVVINAQSSVPYGNPPSTTNNANFVTPPDGSYPTMNLYIFSLTNPKRDSDLDNGVVIHEYMHGITNRLTGGPKTSNCLTSSESGGMGEGWSDMLAMILLAKSTDTRETNYVMGSYVVNNKNGIRSYPYSTNLKINPLLRSSAPAGTEVHALGEIWASMLLEVYWNMVDKSGFTSRLLDDVNSGKGNSDFLQLLIDALKLQPCNPTFINARDAILLADTNRGSKYKCLIWKGFAKRGLGYRYAGKSDDFTLPAECSTVTPPPPPPTCKHHKCVVGTFLEKTCDSCVEKVCKETSSCCTKSWAKKCVKKVKSLCNITC